MKKFDEVRNILVDVSGRFTTAIIIDCIVFILILTCLILAIRTYNKNVEEENASFRTGVLKQINDEKNKIDIGDIDNGLRQMNIIDDQAVDAGALQKAMNNKDIFYARNISDFAGVDILQYKVYNVRNSFGCPFYLLIKENFDVKTLLKSIVAAA